MTLPKFRLRTLMIAMAIVAVTLAAEKARRQTARLTAEYRARSVMWQRKMSVAVSQAAAYDRAIRAGLEPGPESDRWYRAHVRQAEFAQAMALKYRRAVER